MHYMILHIKSKSPKKYPKMENWTSSFTTFPNLFLQALTKECRNMFSVYISNFLPGNGAQVPRYWKLANAMLTATLLLFLSLFLQKKTATRISTEHLEDFFLLRNFLTPTWFSQKKNDKKTSVLGVRLGYGFSQGVFPTTLELLRVPRVLHTFGIFRLHVL